MPYAHTRASALAFTLLGGSSLLGCQSADDGTGLGEDPPSNPSNPNGGSGVTPEPSDVDFGDIFGDGGGSGTGGSRSIDPAEACVADSREGSRTVIALYFMVDISGSMLCPVPDSVPSCEVDPQEPYSPVTRWTETSAALRDFFSSPESGGMWAGAAFFPRSNGGSLACSGSDYATPDAEIALLPAAASDINSVIDAQTPGGYTPTVASLQGAIQHAKNWSAGNPDQQVVVVYATDGYPRGCGSSNDIGNAAEAAAEAFAGSPSVRTYVLGVGSNLTDLDQIATAGGTERAFLVDVGQDVTAQLAAALAAIRSDVTLDCAYTIPAPPAGQQLNYDLVNIRFTDGNGSTTDIARDPSAGDCNVGWQYSADRTQIMLCGDTCDAVKADPGARIDVLFGCATVVDVIR